MKTPFEIILDKLINIEKRLENIEDAFNIRAPKRKKKVTLITDEEATKILLKKVFKVNIRR